MGRPKNEGTIAKEKDKQIEKYGFEFDETIPNKGLLISQFKKQRSKCDEWIKNCNKKIEEYNEEARKQILKRIKNDIESLGLIESDAKQMIEEIYKKEKPKDENEKD